MTRIGVCSLVLLILVCSSQDSQAEDIFFTISESTASLNEIANGAMPTDTGLEMITLTNQGTATLMLWSDGELVIDPSTGPAFGYSVEADNSDNSVTGIGNATSINPMGSDGRLRWFDTFDFGINWTAIGAATFDSGMGIGPNRKVMDPFYDPNQNAFLLGYTTLTANAPGVSVITPNIVPILSLNGTESVGGVTVTVTPIPEPGTAIVGVVLLAGMILRRRRSC